MPEVKTRAALSTDDYRRIIAGHVNFTVDDLGRYEAQDQHGNTGTGRSPLQALTAMDHQ